MHTITTTPTLSAKAYTSSEWFEKEMIYIFGNTWQFAGFQEDLKDVGDYLTVQCGHQHILVVKTENNQFKAFHNLCRHRGGQLLHACGKGNKAITCPYHNWAYNLKGELIGVPHQRKEFPNLDKSTKGLHQASVAIWRGMIWVHPNKNAGAIDKWFSGCTEKLGPHQPQRLIEYPDSTYEKVIQANWKIVAENYMDVYHLSQLHSSTLNMYNHHQAAFEYIGNHFLFREPLSKKYAENLDKLMPYKRIREVTDDYLGAYVPWLFPNLGLVETESSWSTFHLTPISPEQTKVVIRTKLEPMSNWEYIKQSTRSQKHWEKLMGKHPQHAHLTNEHPLNSGDFMEEDIFVCEQQQKAMKNPLFSVTDTALHGEKSIREFQRLIDSWVKENK